MGANKHLEHIEDLILLEGKGGAEKAIKALRSIVSTLSGSGGPSVRITTKWDGAPAIICGIDPKDGKFFVGTKAVFNANDPKIAKTQADVQRMYSGGLADKISYCLRYLPAVVDKGVLQGDLLFTNDKSRQTIDGKSYVTFRPNTITYAADSNSDVGRDIQAASMGVVFHTSYSGSSIPTMNASFGVSDSQFKKTGQVWAQTAEYRDVGNVAALSGSESSQITAAINQAEGSMKQSGNMLNQIQSGGKALQLDTEFKKFFNQYFRGGTGVSPVDPAYVEFVRYLGSQYNIRIEKNKTLEAQASNAFKYVEALDFITDNEKQFKMVIATYKNIMRAKNMLVNKLNAVEALDTFVVTPNGYKVTNQEGYVAISGGQAVKLVDRIEFSNLNFNTPKNWGN